jgi:hypothetical protein
MDEICSCGCAEAHPIATRETADHRRVRVWSDGMVTHADPFGTHIRGIGPVRIARSSAALAGRDLVECIGFFDFAELPTLVRTARALRKHTYRSDDARRADIVRTASKTAKAAALRESRP